MLEGFLTVEEGGGEGLWYVEFGFELQTLKVSQYYVAMLKESYTH